LTARIYKTIVVTWFHNVPTFVMQTTVQFIALAT